MIIPETSEQIARSMRIKRVKEKLIDESLVFVAAVANPLLAATPAYILCRIAVHFHWIAP